jgi:LEA14-like dessication related protein
VYHWIAKARAVKNMNFFPGGVSDIHFDGATPILTLALIAHNTSNQQMTVNSFDANLTANGTYVGNASSFTPQTIMANSQTTVMVNIRLSLLNIVTDIIKAFQYGNFSQTVRLTGNANVDNIQVPVDMNFTVG